MAGRQHRLLWALLFEAGAAGGVGPFFLCRHDDFRYKYPDNGPSVPPPFGDVLSHLAS